MSFAGDRYSGFLVVGTLGAERRQQGAERGDDPPRRDQDGSRTVARAQQQDRRFAWLPEGDYGRPTAMVAMRRLDRKLAARDGVCARADDGGGSRRPQMDGRREDSGRRAGEIVESRAQELPQSGGGSTLSGTAAERHLGHGALSPQRFGAVSLLAAEACKRAPAKILRGPPRL